MCFAVPPEILRLTRFPSEWVPEYFTVEILPSAEMVRVPVIVTLPSSLYVNSLVRSPIFFRAMVPAVCEPRALHLSASLLWVAIVINLNAAFLPSRKPVYLWMVTLPPWSWCCPA